MNVNSTKYLINLHYYHTVLYIMDLVEVTCFVVHSHLKYLYLVRCVRRIII